MVRSQVTRIRYRMNLSFVSTMTMYVAMTKLEPLSTLSSSNPQNNGVPHHQFDCKAFIGYVIYNNIIHAIMLEIGCM